MPTQHGYAVRVTLDGKEQILLHTIRATKSKVRVQFDNLRFYASHHYPSHWTNRISDPRVVKMSVEVAEG